MSSQPPDPAAIDQMTKALALMNQALDLLDAAGAPAHVGAHLDLAIVRLMDAIPAEGSKDREPGLSA